MIFVIHHRNDIGKKHLIQVPSPGALISGASFQYHQRIHSIILQKTIQGQSCTMYASQRIVAGSHSIMPIDYEQLRTQMKDAGKNLRLRHDAFTRAADQYEK